MSQTNRPSKLVVVTGHAVYDKDKDQWLGARGGYKQGVKLAQHVRDGYQLCQQESGAAALCLSGGRTRRNIGKSEAQGMLDYANSERLSCTGKVLLEEYARDSFENVFYSLLAFHETFHGWPQHVTLVSWKFKVLRFYLIATGLGLARKFTFYGSGDLTSDLDAKSGLPMMAGSAAGELWYCQDIVKFADGVRTLYDPLHRALKPFGKKRHDRTPASMTNNRYIESVKQAYKSSAGLVNRVEQCQPGQEHWPTIGWSW